MTKIDALFQKKLKELKENPHRRYKNNEDIAVSNTDFITKEKLDRLALPFFEFLKTYHSQVAK